MNSACLVALVAGLISVAVANSPQGGPGGVKLDPDDVQVLPDPTEEIVAVRDGIKPGKLELIE